MNPSGRRNILTVADVSVANLIGGAERVLYEQNVRLSRRGYAVLMMTRRLPSHAEMAAVVNGIGEWRYAVDYANPFLGYVSNRRNGKRLFETLQSENRFEAIIIHQPLSAAGLIASRQAKQIKKIYVCHSLSFEEYISRNKLPAKLAGRLIHRMHVQSRKWMEKRALQQADEVITLSRFTQAKLRKAYKIPFRKTVVIPGGVDLTRFKPAENKQPLRQSLKLPESKVVLLTVRNLVPRMGLENLIAAVKLAAGNAPDLFLVIGGDGPLRDELKAKSEKLGMQELVRFVGFIPEDRLPQYYQMADVFILPTRELEGFGLVTLEAMASALPVLGTPVGGTKEILGGFDPSFLFRDTSCEAMAELILQKYRLIKEHPKQWESVSLKCRKFIEDNYSWEKHVDELEKHL